MRNNTETQSKFIRDFFIKNKDILNISAIQKKYKLGSSLESMLKRPNANLSPITIAKLKKFFSTFNITIPENITFLEYVICEEMSRIFDYIIYPSKLHSNIQKRGYVYARNICMLYNLRVMGKSLKISGSNYNKDHATVLHAKSVSDHLYKYDHDFRVVVDAIESKLNITGLIEKS